MTFKVPEASPVRAAAIGLSLTAALAAALTAPAASAAPAVTPAPASMVETGAGFTVDGEVAVYVPAGDAEARRAAVFLTDALARARGLRLAVHEGAPEPGRKAIVLRRDGPAGDEAYRLETGPGGATISAAKGAGLFYGAVTVWQLLTQDGDQGPAVVPGLRVEDAPRFSWRGVMLDSARHYQSPALIRSLIDAMAAEKFNVLQWHLTDDQGWRIEIKKYPRLTEVGAWRVPAGAAHGDIDPKTGKPRMVGGFYTQDEVREVVAYAAARNITVVPEIGMPGHTQAALAAYPRLGAGPAPAGPGADWGVMPYLYNVDDGTFGFLEDVLTEVMALFPSRYVHVGGDEALKTRWKTDPAVQARMRALGIKDENAMQSWFIQRMEHFLEAHGRRLIGWDEILDGGVAANATVMSWRGIDGAVAAAKAGHDAILSPSPTLYLNYRQVPPEVEALGRGDVVSLQSLYRFNPAPAALGPEERKHVIGVQTNLWTEYVPDAAVAQRMLFPRLAAVAEVAWTPAERMDWSDFGRRLPVELGRYRTLGLSYDQAALQPYAEGREVAPDRVRVTLTTPVGLGEIRYTLDGRAPTATSPLYAGPVETALPATVRAAAFVDGRALAPDRERRFDRVSLRRRSSHELKLCSDKVAISLPDDAARDGGHGRADRASFQADILNPCWIYEGADLSGVREIEVGVGQIPYNFQVGDDLKSLNDRLRRPRTPEGELEVRQDGCDGEPIAVLPLKPAAASAGVTRLSARISPRGDGAHSLCFTFAQRPVSPEGDQPLWLLDWVGLKPPALAVDAGRKPAA